MRPLRCYVYYPTGKLACRKNWRGKIILQEIHELKSFVYPLDEPVPEGKFKLVDVTNERLLELQYRL